MKYLAEKWPQRSVILLTISAIVMFGFYQFGPGDTAAQMNMMPSGAEERAQPGAQSWRLYVLPFVKQAVFIIVPGSLAVGVLNLLRRLRSQSNS